MRWIVTAVLVVASGGYGLAQDQPEFSGPQVGEKLAGFKVQAVLGEEAGKEIDLVKAAGGKPIALIFVHERTRPSVGLARLIGSYAASRKKDGLTSGVVFLSGDATATTDWMKIAAGALPKGLPVGIAEGGQEGPGAYGLNRKVTVTVLVGNEDKVTANFALVQPSIQADAPKIAAAIAAVLGEEKGPTVEELERIAGGAARRPEAPKRP
jgi:hypothetical protein